MYNKKQLSFDEMYCEIEQSILKLVFQQTISCGEHNDLIGSVYKICAWIDDGCDWLLQELKKIVENRIRNTRTNLMTLNDDQILLKEHTVEWKKFYCRFEYIERAFMHLDVALVREADNNDHMTVRKLLMDTWRQIVVDSIESRLISSAMKLIEAERNCESFHPDLIIGLRDCLIAYHPDKASEGLENLKQRFEDEYISCTESFYHKRAYQYLQDNGLLKHMKYAQLKIKEEEERGKRYLDEESVAFKNMLHSCDKALIAPFKDTILEQFLPKLRQNDTEFLSIMFWCVDRIPGRIAPMVITLEEYVVNCGLADMKAEAANIVSDPDKYVKRVIDLFKRFTTFVKEAFNDDPRFISANDKAFKIVVNDTSIFKLELPNKARIQHESRCPELLANYCDLLLRRTSTSKKLTLDEIECNLKDAIYVLKYVKNKDVFMQYYTSHLTRRLILQTSNDNDKEESMVRWLRDIGMPANFINKVTQMFQDIKLSEDFNQLSKQRHNYSVDVNAKILNANAWKVSEKMEITLPVELEKFILDIEEFYQRKYNGRKLNWNHNMSTITISFQSNIGKYDLDLTNLQMVVLDTWNQHPENEISFESLRMTTLLSDAELKRTIWSLVAFPHIKEQVLLSSPEAKSPNDFKDETKFTINKQFAVYRNNKPQKRGKINLIGRLQLSTDKTNREDNQAIVALRIFRTQEAIVRVLKTKKTTSVTQLQMEVVEILKNMFLPTISMIKEQLEYLIENEYIRRDENDMNTLIYIT